MIKNIGILGLGWLGLPLAKSFLDDGYTVKGTTTSKQKLSELQEQKIDAHCVLLSETSVQGAIASFLEDLDLLVINIPPKLRRNASGNYVKKIQLLIDYVAKSTIKKIVFVSSTSVYGNVEGKTTEDTIPQPITESGKQLLVVESLLLDNENFTTTIIRFGGLIGPNRHPIKQLSGKKGLKNGDAPINLIHLNDCIHMIKTIVKNGYWNIVFNGVYPYHPTKKEYYYREALKRGVPPPEYDTASPSVGKKIIVNQNFFVKKHTLNTSVVS